RPPPPAALRHAVRRPSAAGRRRGRAHRHRPRRGARRYRGPLHRRPRDHLPHPAAKDHPQVSLSVQRLSFSYRTRTIPDEIPFAVVPGAFCALLGPNRSGKSTLVKAIAGVHRPRSGAVAVEGRRSSTLSRRELAKVVSYVPQTGDAPFDLTVREAVMLGRTPHFGL